MSGHRCVFGAVCVSAVRVGDGRVGKAVEVADEPCRGCEGRFRRCVGGLPVQWLRLREALGESAAVVGGGRRPKPESSLPINVGADALMKTISRRLYDAAVLVGEDLNVELPRLPTNPGSLFEYRMVVRCVALVKDHVGELVSTAAGCEVAVALVRAYTRSERHLGEAALRERLHMPCPKCGQQCLVRETLDRVVWSSGAAERVTPQVVRCLVCREEWDESQYRWLSRMVLSEHERKEQKVLEWLLAEVNWKFNDAQEKLAQLERLAGLSAEDLEGIDAAAVVAMVREILA